MDQFVPVEPGKHAEYPPPHFPLRVLVSAKVVPLASPESSDDQVVFLVVEDLPLQALPVILGKQRHGRIPRKERASVIDELA